MIIYRDIRKLLFLLFKVVLVSSCIADKNLQEIQIGNKEDWINSYEMIRINNNSLNYKFIDDNGKVFFDTSLIISSEQITDLSRFVNANKNRKWDKNMIGITITAKYPNKEYIFDDYSKEGKDRIRIWKIIGLYDALNRKFYSTQ